MRRFPFPLIALGCVFAVSCNRPTNSANDTRTTAGKESKPQDQRQNNSESEEDTASGRARKAEREVLEMLDRAPEMELYSLEPSPTDEQRRANNNRFHGRLV